MANGNGHGLIAPDWTSLKAWAQAIGFVGIPGAIAIFLVFIGATEVPKLVRQLNDLQGTMAQVQVLQTQQIQLLNQLIRTSQQACYNTAKDDLARQRCFDR